MSEPIPINTGKYNKEGKVNIDGQVWSVTLPGAGSELRLSQAFRSSKLWGKRLELIDRKITADTATEEDLDKYEEYGERYAKSEKLILDMFTQFFNDGTPDNASVKKWIEETPAAIIQLAFEDIKQQANQPDEPAAPEDQDGQEEAPTSS